MRKNFIVGLDIGTSAIKVVILENQGNKPVLRAVFKEPSAGLRKGAITDLTESSQAVGRVIQEVRRISKNALKNIYISIGTPLAKAQNSRGIVAISRADNEIYQDDVDRVVRASQALNLTPNRMIIHTFTREFIIDGVADIVDPLGLSGSRLEVSSLVVDAFAPHIKSLMRVVELVGGEIGAMIFTPVAAGRGVLTKTQKDLGVVLIDIGASTTGVSIYEENRLLNVAKFPVGAANISNDLAVGLKIPVTAAENLKLSYGYALSRDVGLKEMVELKKFHPEARGIISRRLVADIIEARLAEILEFVNNELKLLGKAGKLAGGAVFVGGGAKLPGLTELAKQELKLFSQIGLATDEGGWVSQSSSFSEFLEDPEFATAMGLVALGADQENWGSKDSSFDVVKKIKRFFGYFKP
ncbi:MAG: cell division protein FtsA [Candidatus Paceibacterota bacterium]|jgi:cell division protein FtsA